MYISTSDQPVLELGFYNASCNWGMHMAGLYETEEERDEIIFGLLKQGYLEGDLQLYCPAERTKEDFLTSFSNACPHCKKDLEKPEHFQILSTKDLYYPTGIFSPEAMDTGLNEFYEQSQKNGPRNIRATAEMVWALEAVPGVEHLMAYESRLNYFIPGKPWISICLYNINKFGGEAIIRVLQTHPYVINGGVITKNPYYQDPTRWLSEHAPEYLPEQHK